MTEVERALQKHGYSASNSNREALIAELLKIEGLVADLTTAAAKDDPKDDPWSVVYDVVFSEKVSRRVFAIADDLGRRFEYYDPDEGYDDDVLAFARALKDYADEFRPQPEPEPEVREWPNADDCGCGQRWCSTCN